MSKGISEPSAQANPYIDRVSLVQGSIARQAVDGILIMVTPTLMLEGAMNEEIAVQAGPQLQSYMLENIPSPKPGDVATVPGFDLPTAHIFVGIVPALRTEFDRQDKSLLDICRGAIGLAKGMKLSSLAIPLLQGGKYGYPKKKAARLIASVVIEELDQSLKEIRLVTEEAEDLALFAERLQGG